MSDVETDRDGRMVPPCALTDFTTAVLRAYGVPAPDADLLADSLVTAELWGHASHGMLRLPWYVELTREGQVKPAARPFVQSRHQATARVDGAGGWAPVSMMRWSRRTSYISKASAVAHAALTRALPNFCASRRSA